MEGELIRVSGTLAAISDLEAFTDGWLGNRRLSDHTRDAYRRDMTSWFKWCNQHDLDPLTVTFVHVNRYARDLEDTTDPRTGRKLSPATVARKLSGLSSWFAFLVKTGNLPNNPVSGADRPKVRSDTSATRGLAGDEVDRFLAAAANLRDRAMLTLIADLGLRVSEATNLDIESLGYERGGHVVRYVAKGGEPRRRPIPEGTWAAVASYLRQRAKAADCPVSNLSGPLFVSDAGNRIDRHRAFEIVQQAARVAGLDDPRTVVPHSLRHAFATAALQEGVPLEDVQDAMGHADPRTTQRYNRDRHNLDKDPSLVLARARERRHAGNGS